MVNAATQNDKQNETQQATALVTMDPRELIVDRNVREETQVDPDLVASIKDLGVLQPIVAVRATGAGDEPAFRVRYGHRRTLAAIEAERPTVPVYVIGDETTDTPAEIERLLGQYAENEHRTGLTAADKVNVVQQLSLLKVSTTKIAKRTRMASNDVDRALEIGKSATALEHARSSSTSEAGQEDPGLTLEHLAAIAEFEDNSDAIQRLVKAAHTFAFDHTLAGLRRDRELARDREVAASELAADGVRVIILDRTSEAGRQVRRLDFLTDQTGEVLTAETHAACPGHIAWPVEEWVWVAADGTELADDDEGNVDDEEDDPSQDAEQVRRWRAEFGCENFVEHGHRERWAPRRTVGLDGGEAEEKSEEQLEAERTERRRVIAGNKQWDAAVGVRRAWLRQFLARKTMPAGAIEFIAHAVAHADPAVRQAFERNHPLAANLFGLDVPQGEPAYLYGRHREAVVGLVDSAAEKRQIVITLGLLLAAYEDSLHRMTWRGDGGQSGDRRYLQFLADRGYELCNTERLAAGLPTEDNGDGVHVDLIKPATD